MTAGIWVCSLPYCLNKRWSSKSHIWTEFLYKLCAVEVTSINSSECKPAVVQSYHFGILQFVPFRHFIIFVSYICTVLKKGKVKQLPCEHPYRERLFATIAVAVVVTPCFFAVTIWIHCNKNGVCCKSKDSFILERKQKWRRSKWVHR